MVRDCDWHKFTDPTCTSTGSARHYAALLLGHVKSVLCTRDGEICLLKTITDLVDLIMKEYRGPCPLMWLREKLHMLLDGKIFLGVIGVQWC